MKSSPDQKIVTRIAPSPTGLMHVGTARTALFNYLFTRQNNGKIILRIEDTDEERSTKENEKNIIDGFDWLGLGHDEFFRQSDRLDIYKKYLKDLVDKGIAYVSKEEINPSTRSARSGQEKERRPEVIRFKNPNKKVTFNDLIHGDITIDTSDLGDFVIAKDMDTPIFHLANVVDDKEMGVTHIIRGDDHMSNTPRQILIMEAIEGTVPIYAHLPMLLSPDKAKLSKRHGAWPVTEYRDQGYLKEAIINFIALLGWSPQTGSNDNTELLSLNDLLHRFKIDNVQKKGAIFDIKKLNWLNHEYLKNEPDNRKKEEIEKYCPETIKKLPGYSDELFEKIIPLIAERINYYGETTEILNSGQFNFFFEKPEVKLELLKTTEFLTETINRLKELDKNNFTIEEIKNALWDFATEKGRAQVLWPMRVALTGQEKSPDPFTVASILGKEETLLRLTDAQ